MTSPLGILGGTFDPIHHGHLRLAQEVLEQCGLTAVRFIPVGVPPHRSPPFAAPLQRLEMVRRAIHGNPGFQLDEREVHRNEPCYTVDTLLSLRAEFGGVQPMCLLMGGDAFLQFHTWRDWKRILQLAHLVVVQRAGDLPLGNAMNRADAELQAEYRARLAPGAQALSDAPSGAIMVIDMPLLEISATDIRGRCAKGKSLRYLLPDAVVDYIGTLQLYQ